jgi:hypothetical protein
MALTSTETFHLSRWFGDLSTELEQYCDAKWDQMSDDQRKSLKNAELTLRNTASSLRTTAVGLVLDETEVSFNTLQQSTERAKGAIKTLKTVGRVITVATAAVGLAAAIASKDVGAIGKNAKSLYDAATTDV